MSQGTSSLCAHPVNQINAASGDWWLVESHPNWRDRVIDDIQCSGGTAFILKSEVLRERKHKDGHPRIDRYMRAIWPCIFACIFGDYVQDYLSASSNNLAAIRSQRVKGQQAFHHQLLGVATALHADPGLGIDRIRHGDRVRIIGGAYANIHADYYVLSTKPGYVYLPIPLLGNAAPIPIEEKHIELIEAAAAA